MWRCACNSRLNLVRLFVNPPHPTRARTPPVGYVCARCACVPARLFTSVPALPVVSAPACACLCAPGYYYLCAVRSVRSPCACILVSLCLCASLCIPLHPSVLPGCGGATWPRLHLLSTWCTCLGALGALAWFLQYPGLCSVRSVLTWFPLASLWPTPACSRPPVCRAARSLRSSLLLAPRVSRGSVTIVCYNQSSASHGIAYNLAVCFNGSTLQRGTGQTAAG